MKKEYKPFNLIYEAEWNDIPCADYPIEPEKWVRECFSPLIGTKVDTLFYNLCSSDGYCCQLNSGQILMDNFSKVNDAWVWRYRENTKRLIEAGANPPDMAVKHGHDLGLKVIPVVRMNDMHDMFFKYEVSEFKQKNPHLLLGYGKYTDWEKSYSGHPEPDTINSFTWGMFDFAYEEVRRHKLAVIEEFITRWDNDGVSLDFDRDPMYFKEEDSEDNRKIMTDLIRDVRKMLDLTAAKRGRKLYLHVRVMPVIETCAKRGLDVGAWVGEGLVDAISPGCGYMTFSLDLRPWTDLTAGKECWIYPCMNKWKTAEITRAWAKWMYLQGADGVYLFNWGHLLFGFDKETKPVSERLGTIYFDELNPCYYSSLNEINDAGSMKFKDSIYSLESVPHKNGKYESADLHRRFRAIDAIRLPLDMSVGKHSVLVPFAEKIEGIKQKDVQAELRMFVENHTYPDWFELYLNGRRIYSPSESGMEIKMAFIMSNETLIKLPVDIGILHQGLNEIIIDIGKTNEQMETIPVLRKLELAINYSKKER